MATFSTKLTKKETVAAGTMAFYLEKPENYSYIPGQHTTVLITKEGVQDDRTFSFITIPTDTEIGFTTRMREASGFKNILKDLPLGSALEVQKARGSMVLPTTATRPLVFLAGGIGITPFMSMVKQAAVAKLSQKIFLFYANRKVEEAPFLEELNTLKEQNANFTFIPVMTKEDPSRLTGETGHITQQMIRKYISDLNNTIFYLAGPAGMVGAMTQTLSTAGVDSLFIKSEDFGEYK